ncbi:MAG: mechanosensitive ion channel family protein [bacterium]
MTKGRLMKFISGWGLMFACLFGAGAQDLQQDSTARGNAGDTVRRSTRVSGGSRSGIVYSDTTVGGLMLRLENLTQMLNKDLGVLKRGFDTVEISRTLPELEEMLAELERGMEKSVRRANLRNLHSEKVTLQQIEKQLKGFQERLHDYSRLLIDMDTELKEAVRDPGLKVIPADAELRRRYYEQLNPLMARYQAADKMLDRQMRSIGLMHNRVSAVYFNCSELLEGVDFRLKDLQSRIIKRDAPYLWVLGPEESRPGLYDAWRDGIRLAADQISFFFSRNLTRLFTILSIALLLYGWILYNMWRLKRDGEVQAQSSLHFLARSPGLSVMLAFFTLLPFLMQNPPMGFVICSWSLMMIFATLIRWHDWSRRFRRAWTGTMVLFLILAIDGLLQDDSRGERFILLGLNLFSLWLGVFLYREVKKEPTRYHTLMDESILVFMVMNLLAIFMNMGGRLQMARTFSSSSVLSITLLLALQIIKDIFMESLYLQLEARRHSRISAVIGFDRFRSGLERILRVVTLVLWVLAFAWSLNLLDVVMEWVGEFLSTQRSLGEFTFTYGSILVFIVVLWFSFTIAGLVNYFFRVGEAEAGPGRRGRSGSGVLLLRLGVIVIGFMLAIAAAGIPTDRLTIILGSLGVGIGFGLQNVVSNLMSGIMLAFEKPMQIGDVIEIGTRIGTVREIGIRSSKIATYDGAVIIVPNGEFITQQLINWTHDNNNSRRVELLVGVSYGSDLEQVRTVINEVIAGEPDVASDPEPLILVHEFAASAVTFRVLVWTNDFDRASLMKSLLLQHIHEAFARSGIEIPLPQTDLRIRSLMPLRKTGLIPPDARPDDAGDA